MSLTLLEAAKLVQDPLKRGVIEIFPRISPVLERLPFFNVYRLMPEFLSQWSKKIKMEI